MMNLAEEILDQPVPPGSVGQLFEMHPAPSLIFTRSGVIEQANAAARALLRADAALLVGAALVEFFPEVGPALAQIRGATCHRRVAVRRADGSNFIARVHGATLGAGEAATLLASFVDLTEFELEIAAANKEFESFTSAAGHDLRGPLRILTGFTEALEEECGATLNEEGATFLKEILKASERMEGLIDGLLGFSRAGRAEVACERIDVSTLVELVYYELRHSQTERDVDCQVQPQINVWADVRLMMTILRNLLGNAWKYTGRTAQPTIGFHAQERAGRTWCCVTDNGAGFDMAQADRLFKPFTRLHRQDEFPGHGMGLATVQRIVKRHGGEIEIEAAVGRGATVRFWLPGAPE